MPIITLRRKSESEAGRLRRIQVFVDGRPVARLRPGASETLQLADGSCVLRAKMDWFASEELVLRMPEQAGTTVEFSLPSVTGLAGFIRPSRGIRIELLHRE